eukprot:2929853-Heterocapsa_arctica.AAC.1
MVPPQSASMPVVAAEVPAGWHSCSSIWFLLSRSKHLLPQVEITQLTSPSSAQLDAHALAGQLAQAVVLQLLL